MKRILAMVISVVLVATMAIGGSLAYLQDSDGRVNTMVMGNVYIEQIEQQRVIVCRAGGGAKLDKAPAEHLVHLAWPEVFRDRRADDGAVVIIIAYNTRIGIYLRGIVNRRHVARGQMINLERIDRDD